MSVLYRLPIHAANGSPLVHKFYTHGTETRNFIMFMPGGNYGPDAPMLYYPRELLMAQGWDTLDIQFGYQTTEEELTLEKAPTGIKNTRSFGLPMYLVMVHERL